MSNNVPPRPAPPVGGIRLSLSQGMGIGTLQQQKLVMTPRVREEVDEEAILTRAILPPKKTTE